jgi:hypothetical protein
MFIGMCSLVVAQTPPATEEDIRGPRELIEIPVPENPSYFWWWVALAVIIVIVLAIIFWRWHLSRQPGASAMSKAIAALRVIEEKQTQLDDESYAAQVADVLRAYVVVAYGIAAPQRTSEEFLQECLQREIMAAPSLQNLRAFLRSCDIAKFAAGSLTAMDRQSMLGQVKDMVLAPLPKAEETPTSSAA